MPVHHDLEQAIVDLRGRSHEHAAAVGLRVAGTHAEAGERQALTAVEVDLEARRLPRRQGAQGAVGVHEVALDELGLVGDAVGLGVEAAARDPDERPAVHVADVDQAFAAGEKNLACRPRIQRQTEGAREVVPPPAGQDAEHAVGPRQDAGDGTDQPIPAERHRGLVGVDRRSGEQPGVVEAGRALDVVLDVVPAQHRLDLGQRGRRAAAARGRVDDEGEGATLGHRRAKTTGEPTRARASTRRPRRGGP